MTQYNANCHYKSQIQFLMPIFHGVYSHELYPISYIIPVTIPVDAYRYNPIIAPSIIQLISIITIIKIIIDGI